jgi:predicted kinase
MRQWRVATTDEILTRVRRAVGEPAGRPPVLAVDGRSSSGKSTFAGRLAQIWDGAAVVHTDDIAWRQAVLDWTDLLVDGVLTPARAGRPVAFRPPKWDEGDRPGAIEVPPECTLLIVEGVGSGRRALAAHLDAVIWVESPPDDVDRRNAARVAAGETTDEHFDAWQAEEAPFVEAEQTWERAAFLIAGWPAVPHDAATEFVICS